MWWKPYHVILPPRILRSTWTLRNYSGYSGFVALACSAFFLPCKPGTAKDHLAIHGKRVSGQWSHTEESRTKELIEYDENVSAWIQLCLKSVHSWLSKLTSPQMPLAAEANFKLVSCHFIERTLSKQCVPEYYALCCFEGRLFIH